MSERMTDEDWAELKDGMVQGREWWKEYGPEIAAELDRARANEADLLAALEMIAGERPCIDNLMSDKDIARAAIAKAKGEHNG
jgi:hypothetical protein